MQEADLGSFKTACFWCHVWSIPAQHADSNVALREDGVAKRIKRCLELHHISECIADDVALDC